MLERPTLVAGSFTRTGYQAISATHSKGGSVRGTSVVTLSGTPTYGSITNYEFVVTNARTGAASRQSGLFLYARRPGVASLANFILAFGAHLEMYHDVLVGTYTATGFTLTSSYWGYNPSLTIANTVTASSAVGVAATPPRVLVPGDAVVIRPTLSGYVATSVAAPGSATDMMLGLVVDDGREVPIDGRDVIYSVAINGFVGVECRGTTAGSSSSANMLMYTNGTRPGSFGFGGFTDGATTSITAGASNNTSTALINMGRQFRPVSDGIVPGQIFEMKISDAI